MSPALQVNNIAAASSLWDERLRQWSRIKQWSLRLAEFGIIQALVQLLTAAAGLVIVRTMSKHDYALYAIASSMQVTANLLADLGIGIGVGSIGGRVWNNPQRFSQLINTAVGLRWRFALISLGCILPLSAWMLFRNGGPWTLTLGLCVTVVAGVIPLLGLSVFNATLRLHSQYRRIQKLDLGNAGLRLGLIGTLALTRMNALLAAGVGVVGNWVQLIFARRWARESADPAAQTSPHDHRELMKLSWRWMPNVIFFCFQGQITLLILTLLGTPVGVADITALGRIAALLAILSVTFSNVLVPRFARCQDHSRLLRLYVLLVAGTALVLLPVFLLAWLLPGPFLWLLGEKYANLERECALVVATSCVSQIGSAMANLNLSKAWIRIQAIGAIPTLLIAQAVAALCLDLRQFHHVLVFNLVTTASPIWLFALDAYFGVRRDIRSEPGCKSVWGEA